MPNDVKFHIAKSSEGLDDGLFLKDGTGRGSQTVVITSPLKDPRGYPSKNYPHHPVGRSGMEKSNTFALGLTWSDSEDLNDGPFLEDGIPHTNGLLPQPSGKYQNHVKKLPKQT